MPRSYEVFELGDFALQGGAVLRDAKLAFETFGELNDDRSNAIVYPTWFSGRQWENEWLIGPGMALDPAKYFIIIPNMFGNGLSSSPSNMPPPYNGPHFPKITFYDQVEAQHRLVVEKLGIEKLFAVTGWSMGAAQTFQWAVSYPEMVPRALPFCGSARTSEHNKVFLEAVMAAITTDAAWDNGRYTSQPEKGMRALGRVYAGWGLSQAWYWNKLYTEMGYQTLEDFLVGYWEGFFLDGRDANNLLAMAWTWSNGNVGNTPGFGGDHEAALASITAKMIVMPGQTDLYFPPEDEAYEASFIPNAELDVIPSIWGHFAGGGGNQVDTDYIDAGLKRLFAS